MPPARWSLGTADLFTNRSLVPCLEVRRSMAEIIFINPRFEVSYWGLEHALPLIGKRANMPVGLPAAAGGLDPSRTLGDPARREYGGHRFRSVCPGRYRWPDRDGRPARSDAGDPGRAQAARGVRGCGRSVGHGQGRRLRRIGGCGFHRRGRRDVAPVSRRMAAR